MVLRVGDIIENTTAPEGKPERYCMITKVGNKYCNDVFIRSNGTMGRGIADIRDIESGRNLILSGHINVCGSFSESHYQNKNYTSDTIGYRIGRKRTESGLSINKLSEMTGIAKSTIDSYETGKRFPSFYNMILIADALDVSLDWIAGRY